MPISFDMRAIAPADVLLQEIEGEAVLLNIRTEQYYGLDLVGTRMRAVLTESQTIGEGYRRLLAEFDVDGEQLRADVLEFLERLLEQGLVEVRYA